MKSKTYFLGLSLLCVALLTTNVWAADSAGEPGRSAGGKNPLKNVYFGEQHLHTRNSFDALRPASPGPGRMPIASAGARRSSSPPPARR